MKKWLYYTCICIVSALFFELIENEKQMSNVHCSAGQIPCRPGMRLNSGGMWQGTGRILFVPRSSFKRQYFVKSKEAKRKK